MLNLHFVFSFIYLKCSTTIAQSNQIKAEKKKKNRTKKQMIISSYGRLKMTPVAMAKAICIRTKNCCAFYKSTEHERQLNYEIIYFFFAPFVSSIFNTSNYQIAITLRCVWVSPLFNTIVFWLLQYWFVQSKSRMSYFWRVSA